MQSSLVHRCRAPLLLASLLFFESVRPSTPFVTSPQLVHLGLQRDHSYSVHHHQARRCGLRSVLQTQLPAVLSGSEPVTEGGQDDGVDTGNTARNATPPRLNVLYEDEHLAVVEKPGGMLMHRTRDSRRETVFFLQTCRDQLGKQVFFVNRIDRGTSGLVLMAFDGPTAAKLQIALASEEASKEYLCVVRGTPEEDSFDVHRALTDKDSLDKRKREAHTTFRCVTKFTIPVEEEFRADLPRTVGAEDPRVTDVLGVAGQRDEAKGGDEVVLLAQGQEVEAIDNVEIDHLHERNDQISEKKLFKRDMGVSVLVVRIFTGRRHQIRRHLQHEALNVLGDTSYGKGRINKALREQHCLPRMMLHAWRLSFRHPFTDEVIALEDPMPDDMMQFLVRLDNSPSAAELSRLLEAVPYPIQPLGEMPTREPRAPHFDGERHSA